MTSTIMFIDIVVRCDILDINLICYTYDQMGYQKA